MRIGIVYALLAIAALGAALWLALRPVDGIEGADPAPPLQGGEEVGRPGPETPPALPELQVVPPTQIPRLAVLDRGGTIPPPSDEAHRHRQEYGPLRGERGPLRPEDVVTMDGKDLLKALQECVYVRVRTQRVLEDLERLDMEPLWDRGELTLEGVLEVLSKDGYRVEDRGDCLVIGRE